MESRSPHRLKSPHPSLNSHAKKVAEKLTSTLGHCTLSAGEEIPGALLSVMRQLTRRERSELVNGRSGAGERSSVSR